MPTRTPQTLPSDGGYIAVSTDGTVPIEIQYYLTNNMSNETRALYNTSWTDASDDLTYSLLYTVGWVERGTAI